MIRRRELKFGSLTYLIENHQDASIIRVSVMVKMAGAWRDPARSYNRWGRIVEKIINFYTQ